jgi:transposase InsO family protein
MTSEDVKDLLELAVKKTGLEQVAVRHRPRLLSDNGSAFVSDNLATFLEKKGMSQSHGAPYHPMTQGKIERYHRSMKNVINLQKYFFPWELEREIAPFVQYYNNKRYHESLGNVTPADVYFGRHREIFTRREQIKRRTLKLRKRYNLANKSTEPKPQHTQKPSLSSDQKLSGTF